MIMANSKIMAISIKYGIEKQTLVVHHSQDTPYSPVGLMTALSETSEVFMQEADIHGDFYDGTESIRYYARLP